MKEELIKYVMERAQEYYAHNFPILSIEMWIREFFDHYQPERSKREDFDGKITKVSVGIIIMNTGEQFDIFKSIEDAVL